MGKVTRRKPIPKAIQAMLAVMVPQEWKDYQRRDMTNQQFFELGSAYLMAKKLHEAGYRKP